MGGVKLAFATNLAIDEYWIWGPTC
jgi:hypothetical protein